MDEIIGAESICRFCGEEIEFKNLPQEALNVLVNKGAGLRPGWLHKKTTMAMCQTFAKPVDKGMYNA